VAAVPLERGDGMTAASDYTLLDVADRLLDTGVALTGEATISVADVDLIYLGLDVVLASVEKIRGKGNVPIVPFPRWPDELGEARPPGAQTEMRSGEVEHLGRASGFAASEVRKGPGAMSSATYPEVNAVPERIDVDPDEVERGLAKLVLTIIEFIRQLLERQAVRRMDGGGLTDAEIERVGIALMRLDEKVGEMAGRFGLKRDELKLGLGPLGQLV